MSPNFPPQLDNVAIIAGLFREGLFFSRSVLLKSPDQDHEFLIAQVREASARSKEPKDLVLKCTSKNQYTPKNEPVRLTCFFPHFVASWTAQIKLLSDGTYSTALPNRLDLDNQRDSLRFSLKNSTFEPTPVLVRTGNRTVEGLFELEDTSSHGLGGKLFVDANIESENTWLKGKAHSSHGAFAIDGLISHATLLSEGLNETFTFRVGLRTPSAAQQSRNELLERRAYSRTLKWGELVLNSPLRPDYRIQVNLRDVAISGFSAELSNPLDKNLLPLGISVIIPGLRLTANIVSFEDKIHRFQISGGDSEARLKWLKQISTSQHERISTSNPMHQELIDLFCESGALAAGFLGAQSAKASQLVKDLGAENFNSGWIHRWIEQTDDGKSKGHVSALRLGDNLWMMADLAGTSDESKKLSRQFISSFFSSFMEFCLTCKPCPGVLVTWNVGHPYWKKIESILLGDSSPETLEAVYADYTRFTGPLEESTHLELARIDANEFKKIEDIRSRVRVGRSILSFFDFSIHQFGSPLLRSAIDSAGLGFCREYVHIKDIGHEWVAVISGFPNGVSPNRTPDVIWVFPVGNSEAVLPEGAKSALRKEALGLGLSPPGILEVCGVDAPVRATKKMLWILVHPQALRWFGK